MAWPSVTMRIITTHRVEKYGPIAFSREALEGMAHQINENPSAFPIVDEHDILKSIPSRNARATIEPLEDGHWALAVEVEVPSAFANQFQAGRGISITHWVPLGSVVGPHPERDYLELAAEASVFSDDEIARACELMSLTAPVTGYGLMEFAERSRRRIAMRIAAALALELATEIVMHPLSAGIDYLLSVGSGAASETTRIEIETELPGGGIRAVIDTADPDVVAKALRAYRELVAAAQERPQSGQTFRWDAGGRCWLPVAVWGRE